METTMECHELMIETKGRPLMKGRCKLSETMYDLWKVALAKIIQERREAEGLRFKKSHIGRAHHEITLGKQGNEICFSFSATL